jgi:hypothetical protein
MGKKHDAEMRKVDAFEAEITAFAERFGILFILRGRDKKRMLQAARQRKEPIELLIAEQRREATSVILGMQERIPAEDREMPTLH